MEHKSKSTLASARRKKFPFLMSEYMIVKVFHAPPFYINLGIDANCVFFFCDGRETFYSSFMNR